MADVKPFIPKIFPWETGVTIDKAAKVKMVLDAVDPGGWTKFGITISTWQTVGYDKDGDGDIDEMDLSLIDVEDYAKVVKVNFWDDWRADEIKSQSIAEILVDWVWASGFYGKTEPQKLLGVNPDGKIGPKTIAAINDYPNQAELHKRLYNQRMVYIERIVMHSIRKYINEVNPSAQLDELKRKTLLKFKQGWINRIDALYKEFY